MATDGNLTNIIVDERKITLITLPRWNAKSNWNNWSYKAFQKARNYDLHKYLLKDIPSADDDIEHEKGVLNSALVEALEPIEDTLLNNGWVQPKYDAAPDPHKLWTFAEKVLDKVSDEHVFDLWRKILNITPDEFTSIDVFVNEFFNLRRQLQAQDFDMKDKMYMVLLLDRLEDYVVIVPQLKIDLRKGTLEYPDLVDQITREVAGKAKLGQTGLAGLAASKKADPTMKWTDAQRATWYKENYANKADYNTDGKHQRCGRFHKGGDAACWIVNPHLATENWLKYNKAAVDEYAEQRRQVSTRAANQTTNIGGLAGNVQPASTFINLNRSIWDD